MQTTEFGRLTEINVRDLWPHEQYDFSNWLAKSDNIELLNDILGLTLVDIDKEVYVGAYRCDLVAKDVTTGLRIIKASLSTSARPPLTIGMIWP